MTWLDQQTFKTVINSTPLISIDLIVRNEQGQVLVGQRCNRPAKDYWFVPGGRVVKNELLSDAFQRLTLAEIGTALSIKQARFIGLFEHFYSDSVFDDNVSTHYIVNGFELVLDSALLSLPFDQHDGYRWLSEADLIADERVHEHSKWYFETDKGYRA